ncbi:intraflagellar transport complex B protein 46, partial [Powellomyces hirtus]
SEYTELFAFIGTYQPQECELPQKLQCFLPEYMPCIGDIDPMIKVVPPSRFPDTNTAVYPATLPNLGITILDEPSASQSDPAVLDLHIRALHKSQMVTPHLSPTKIRSIPLSATSSEATRATHQKALNQWISNMTNLHQHKLPDSVHYVKAMPDIETLMEQWPEEVERAFQSGEVDIPPAEIDLTLAEYGQLICNMIDIPVYFSKDKKKKPEDRHFIESIHVFLTLYLEFKNSQHFGHRQRVEVAPDTS